MPLPMVHLGVAARYFEGSRVPDAFVLGSIAPDSIHMRKDAGREDKARTHFGGKETSPEILKRHYAEFISRSADLDRKWYIKGYFAHVLTDYLWGRSVYAEFKKRMEEEFAAPERIKPQYYLDTDRIDFLLYETAEWRERLWQGLLRAPAYEVSPLLNAQEVNDWRLRTIRWFEQPTNKPEIGPRYITPEVVETFMLEAGDAIRGMIDEWEQ
ncbi:zinc dependent phospholipase C family protein [Saccharibacillus alkalitolerans]|uniref:Zinc dependent phospholipase C family protein n=1 Tax=Saccharibacillus alkalitolerans TaxID=2705290 RepID=A0ABX0FE44_9BACL|nr:zinc dependent phospholipase C family protein [Saccharibacillus alkalitolerans]NGZ76917.1 zinc dependent phospholipase C family protein [Saccharibacillus alkalitolerans]